MLCTPKKTLECLSSSGNEGILQVKGNQASLLDDCKLIATMQGPDDVFEEAFEKKRGRIEKRRVELFRHFKATEKGWEGVKEMICIKRHREVLCTKEKKWKATHETAYFISTTALDAASYALGIRAHWGIENRNHNVRDNAFQEDASRIRKNPTNMARLRSLALNILRQNKVKNIEQELYINAINFNNLWEYKGII